MRADGGGFVTKSTISRMPGLGFGFARLLTTSRERTKMIRLLVIACYAIAGLSFLFGWSAATIQLHKAMPVVVDKPLPSINQGSYAYAWRRR